jgi:hypothetical protein
MRSTAFVLGLVLSVAAVAQAAITGRTFFHSAAEIFSVSVEKTTCGSSTTVTSTGYRTCVTGDINLPIGPGKGGGYTGSVDSAHRTARRSLASTRHYEFSTYGYPIQVRSQNIARAHRRYLVLRVRSFDAKYFVDVAFVEKAGFVVEYLAPVNHAIDQTANFGH